MSQVKTEKVSDLFKGIKWDLMIKACLYASLLMIGTLIGALMRSNGAQGYTIWGVVAVINVVCTIFVFKRLKKDLAVSPQNKKKKAASEQIYATESDK